MSEQDQGASASRPGSHASHGAAAASPPTGFDPSRGPQRAHDLILRVGADNLLDLVWALRGLATNAEREGLSTNCCSGSPSVGFMYSYRSDPAMTHDRYFAEIDEWLARDTNRSGEADETPQAAQPKARAGAEGIAQPQVLNQDSSNG